MSTFNVTTNQRELEVQPGATTQVVFSVTNTSKAALDAQLSLQLGDAGAWAELKGSGLVSFASEETKQISVTVRPPDGGQKSSTLQLEVFGTENPETDTGQSEAVRVLVGKPDPGVPKWVWGLIAAVLVLGGLVIGLVLKSCDDPDPVITDGGGAQVTLPKLGEPCRAGVSCEEDLVCVSAVCRMPTNSRGCDKNEDCEAGRCESEVCVAGLPGLGQACTASICADELVCHSGRCLMTDGAKTCQGGSQCVSGRCEGGTCAPPLPVLGQPCANGKCSGNLTCHDRRCKVPRGASGCSNPAECETGFCDSRGTCMDRRKETKRIRVMVPMGTTKSQNFTIPSGWRYVSHRVSNVGRNVGAQARALRSGNRVHAVEIQVRLNIAFPPVAQGQATLEVVIEQDDP